MTHRNLEIEVNETRAAQGTDKGVRVSRCNAVNCMAVGLLVSSCWLMACAHAIPQAAMASSTVPSVPASDSRTDVGVTAAQTASASTVHLSDEMVRRCQMHFEGEEEMPKFEFDSAGLQDGDRLILDQLISCLTTGPLAGRSVQLIGRADPRGTQQYNFILGQKRAGAVGDYLEAKGVESAHVTEASRGKLDSTGTDEAGWQQDRRVDIELVP
jgi:outer membrane protein OmpA-like peptidoglycan-associated protein